MTIWQVIESLIRRKHYGLKVICSDNYDPRSKPVLKPPLPYMHYYRTEVHNLLDVPLQIVWFEGFHLEGPAWVPSNILRRKLDGKVFSAWYSDGEAIIDGVIPPGGVAVCGTNWHGSTRPVLGPTKWAYKAVDPSGNEHYAEVVLEQKIITQV